MQKGDLTIAFKTIALSSTLSDCQKRVAAALLDHFNRETGRCDPSQATLADILGISPRTVCRATKALQAAGYFCAARHGGKFLCNQYTPNWSRFREGDAIWDRRRRERRARFECSEMSPTSRQASPVTDDNTVTQTCRTNLSKETFRTGSPERASCQSGRTSQTSPQAALGSARQSPQTSPSVSLQPTSSSNVMREAAQRRWDSDLLQRFRTHPSLYGRVVELIDAAVADTATDAELQRRHAGFEYIVRTIALRAPALAAALDNVLGGQR